MRWSLLFVLVFIACDDGRLRGLGKKICEPETHPDCICASGAPGTQSCEAEGTQLGACDCAQAIVLSGLGSSVSAGAFFGVEARLVDALGALVDIPRAGEMTLTLEQGALLGAKPSAIDAGVARFDDLRIEQAQPSAVLLAQHASFSARSESFEVVPGTAVRIALTTPPQGVWDLGAYFSPPPVVEGYDLFGNLTTASAERITAEITAGAGTFRTSGVSTLTLEGGRAVFDRLAVLGDPSAAGALTLRFSFLPTQARTADVEIVAPDLEWARFSFARANALEWTQTPMALQSAAGAIAACASVAPKDGYFWRLPTYIEAMSLFDSGRSGVIRTQSGAANARFSIDLTSGESALVGDGELLSVLCVLATAAPAPAPFRSDAAPAGHFALDPDEASSVRDTRTQLVWQRSDDACPACSWESARAACEALTAGGFDDWRLPSVKELASLVAVRAGSPRWDRDFFAGGVGVYWTSTAAASGHLSLDFATGLSDGDGDVSPRHARCVR